MPLTTSTPAVRLAIALAFLTVPVATFAQGTPSTKPSSGGPTATQRAPAAAPKPTETVVGMGPNGATMRCRDGSYPSPNAPDTACDTKGGLLVRFPVRRVPATAPRAARVPVPPQRVDSTTPSLVAEPFENRARVVVPAERAPAGATFQCNDGTFIVTDTSRTSCAARGGVHLAFPRPRN